MSVPRYHGPLYLPFGFATRTIVGINFAYPGGTGGGGEGGGGGGGGNTGNPPVQPSNIYSCPPNARAKLRGFCYGPAGALAYLATAVNNLVTPPTDQHTMFPDALIIPCGSPFKFVLNHEQTVWALASTAPNLQWGQPDGIVYLTFNWELFFYSDSEAATNGGYDPDPGQDDFSGPRPGWRKRGIG